MPAADDLARERARHEHARLALEGVLTECARAGIDVLPVKGVVTARTLYADPGLRPIQDVDLRVRPRDLGRIAEAGARAGWRLLLRSRAYQTLAFDVLGFLVEVESHVGPPGLCELAIDAMLARATRREGLLGVPHLEPEIHDHALVLCVNAFKDKLVDAMPAAVMDLELVVDQAGFSDERFVALSRANGASTIVWLVAAWLRETRGAARWGAVRDHLGHEAPRALYASIFRRAIRADDPARTLLRVLARMGADRPSARARALGAMAMKLFDGIR